MFIISMTYKKPISVIEEHLVPHRQFLQDCYRKNYYIAAGPKVPRTGGLILSQLSDRGQLEEVLKQDPFVIHDLVSFEITEFNPVTYHKDFSAFMKT